MEEMLDITPHTNLLRSLRGDRIDYVLLVGEGVDNALDAGATEIAITIDPDEIVFRDNGIGITKNRVPSLFSLGDHGAMGTTRLGRFGIGIKSQAVNAGDRFTITSTSADGRLRAMVNWREILKSRKWQINGPSWMPVLVGAATGTTISISDLRKPPPISIEKIIDDIAQRFYPALRGGCKLVVNGISVAPIGEPPLIDIVEEHLSLSDGRTADLRAGMLTGVSKLNRVHVAYEHRVIMPASALGCDGYSGINKMFARVQLLGPWHLAKFKNDLTDETERDELEDAVCEVLKPILEKCSHSNMSARIEELSLLVNDLIPEELQPAKPNRAKQSSGTAKKRKKDAGEVADDKSEPNGPAKTTRRPPQLMITFDGNDEDHGIGEYQSGRVHRVNLGKDNPFIARLIQYRDQQLGAEIICALALMFYDVGRRMLDIELPLEGKLGLRVAKMLAAQSFTAQEHSERKM